MIQIRIQQVLNARRQQWGKRISLTEVAQATGISRMTLHRAIHQHDYKVSTETLDRLCQFFHCDLSELAEYIPEREAA